MDYLSHNVAVNLKQIRLSKGMSLGEVAEQTLPCKSKRNFSYKRTGRAI